MTDADRDVLGRRRLETTEQIHRAALDLFDELGVRATTVPQIAHRAGVSPRTFFRYFRAKEDAAMPGQHRLLTAIDGLDLAGLSPAAILDAVADATERVIRAETDPGLREHERITRLMAREPELRWYAAARDRELGDRLVEHIGAQAASVDAVTARLVAETAVTLWRVMWELWGSQDSDPETPIAVFRRLRGALPRLVGRA